jgi:hypothetical protein
MKKQKGIKTMTTKKTEKTYTENHVANLRKQIENLKNQIETMKNLTLSDELVQMIENTANQTNSNFDDILENSIKSYCGRKLTYQDKENKGDKKSLARFQSAIESIKLFNSIQSEGNRKYCITSNLIFTIEKINKGTLQEYMDKFNDDIQSYNQANNLEDTANRKKGILEIDVLIDFHEKIKSGCEIDDLLSYSTFSKATDL